VVNLSFRAKGPYTQRLLIPAGTRTAPCLPSQPYYEQLGIAFSWTFTRHHLHALQAKIAAKGLAPAF